MYKVLSHWQLQLFTLCSASVNAWQIVFCNISYEYTAICETLRFSNRTKCLCMFSWRICNPLLGESRAAVSKVMMAYTNNGKTSSADRNSGQKPKISERDCCTLQGIVSNNHTTTAARITAERIIHLADHSHKSSPMRASQIHHPGYSCNC